MKKTLYILSTSGWALRHKFYLCITASFAALSILIFTSSSHATSDMQEIDPIDVAISSKREVLSNTGHEFTLNPACIAFIEKWIARGGPKTLTFKIDGLSAGSHGLTRKFSSCKPFVEEGADSGNSETQPE